MQREYLVSLRRELRRVARCGAEKGTSGPREARGEGTSGPREARGESVSGTREGGERREGDVLGLGEEVVGLSRAEVRDREGREREEGDWFFWYG
ncbi:hypothetical protein OIU78_016644 [Salix suchowensis]|nr:hypothetical protein OIU78_016644 [Salix suchowensis]